MKRGTLTNGGVGGYSPKNNVSWMLQILTVASGKTGIPVGPPTMQVVLIPGFMGVIQGHKHLCQWSQMGAAQLWMSLERGA